MIVSRKSKTTLSILDIRFDHMSKCKTCKVITQIEYSYRTRNFTNLLAKEDEDD
jgi:hypothetical protein